MRWLVYEWWPDLNPILAMVVLYFAWSAFLVSPIGLVIRWFRGGWGWWVGAELGGILCLIVYGFILWREEVGL